MLGDVDQDSLYLVVSHEMLLRTPREFHGMMSTNICLFLIYCKKRSINMLVYIGKNTFSSLIMLGDSPDSK